jgi:hypothetical protein
MSFTLELLDTPELPLVMRECLRVLRHNGRVIVVAPAKKKRMAVGVYEWLHLKFPAYTDCLSIPTKDIITEAEFHILEAVGLTMWGLPVDVNLAFIKLDGRSIP